MAKPRKKTDEEQEYDTFDRVMHRIRTEGIEAAFDALVGVCRDEKSAAPARSSAGTAIFRAAGLFDANRDDGTGKAPSEMSPQELARALDKLKRELSDNEARRAIEGADDDPDENNGGSGQGGALFG